MNPFTAFSDHRRTEASDTCLLENGVPTTKGEIYRFDPTVEAAVDVAIGLGRPLLVAGEPGCGKTELGYAVARRLGIDTLYFFAVKSTSEARDLFYTYDAVGRFREAQLAQAGAAAAAQAGSIFREPEIGDFITYQALGRAILDAHPASVVEVLLRGRGHARPPTKPRRSVVIIDEIDKAPRDFTNDLLREIEDLSFRVPELRTEAGQSDATPSGASIPLELRPIIIITSNEESQLPDAFLRRCAFLAISFPKEEQLRAILDLHLRRGYAPDGTAPQAQVTVVKLFMKLRQQAMQKNAGIAELIDAGRILEGRPAEATVSDWLPKLQPALVKLRADTPAFETAVKAVLAEAPPPAPGSQ